MEYRVKDAVQSQWFYEDLEENAEWDYWEHWYLKGRTVPDSFVEAYHLWEDGLNPDKEMDPANI